MQKDSIMQETCLMQFSEWR